MKSKTAQAATCYEHWSTSQVQGPVRYSGFDNRDLRRRRASLGTTVLELEGVFSDTVTSMETSRTPVRPVAFGRGKMLQRMMGDAVPEICSDNFASEVIPNDVMQQSSTSPDGKHRADIQPKDCSFCNRPSSNVVCRACGHTLQGRVRSRCSNHTEVVHLMDFEACPNCKAYQLKEFTPHSPSTQPRGRSRPL